MPDRYAIVSDIHSNLEALTEVFRDIDARKIEKVQCLGDVVGYGPDPEICTDMTRDRCDKTIRGNHDEALFTGADRFNPFARAAIRFTRERLKPGFLRGRRQNAERWEWLRNLPLTFRQGDALFVHGSPRDPVNEYVYQEDVFFNTDKLNEIFEATERVCYCGHTHMPVVIRSDFKTLVPRDEANFFQLEEGFKYIVNVGSVGQPRDRDNRACYVEVDGDVIRYHRIPYDFKATAQKINAEPLLDEILGTRLERGM